MPAPMPPGTEVSGRMLFLAFAAVAGSFLATNLIVQRSSDAAATRAEGIICNSAPSIESLALVRKAVLEVELALSHFMHEPLRRPQLGHPLDSALARLKKETHGYFDLPPFPGGEALRLDVQGSW